MRAIVLVAALLIELATSAPSFNGYQYMGRGFDVAFSDLRPLDVESFGNSFGKFNVMQGDTDDDIQFTPLALYQSDFSTYSINTIEQFANNKSNGISISASYDKWGLSGQGSLDSNKWANSVLNQSSEYYTSFTSASSSQLQLIAGRVTPSFAAGAASLPTSYVGNEQTFLNFIKKFGTHYIISSILGGRQNFWTIVNSSAKAAIGGRSAGGAISVNSRKLVNATLGGTTQQDASDGQTLITAGAVTHVYAYGGDVSLVTNTRDFSAWVNSVLQRQLPISPITMVMQNYIDLVPTASQDALRQALVDYHAGSLKETVTPTVRNTITAFYSLPSNPVYLNDCARTGQRCSGDVNTQTTAAPGQSTNGAGTDTSSAFSVAPIFAFLMAIMFVLML